MEYMSSNNFFLGLSWGSNYLVVVTMLIGLRRRNSKSKSNTQIHLMHQMDAYKWKLQCHHQVSVKISRKFV